jgi:hypothetical protein
MLVSENAATAPAASGGQIRWSWPTLIGFRLGFATAAASLPLLLQFVEPFLYFDAIRKPFNSVENRLLDFETPVAKYIGVSAIRLVTRVSGTVQDVVMRYGYPLCYLIAVGVVALCVTIVWTIADRDRLNYLTLNRWFRIYVRYAVALVMMVYALVKVVPTQFGFLTPGELLRPLGQLNPFFVLWDFMAFSTGYTIFAGLVELTGCVLLFFRHTTVLGSLLLVAALVNLVAMDIAFQVFGALMVAVVLLALVLVLLAPYAAPLASVLLFGRTARMPVEPVTFLSRWRYATLATTVLLVTLVSVRVHDGVRQRRSYFGADHVVYGMFDVDKFARNGKTITPFADDATTWKRVASDGRYDGKALAVQFANGDIRRYGLLDDTANRLWRISEGPTEVAVLHYVVESDDSVLLDGRIGGEPFQIHLHRVELATLPLFRRR